jgi:hypothetical protein
LSENSSKYLWILAKNTIHISFDRNPEFKDIFNTFIPIEIKSGYTGHMKSVPTFIEKHKSEIALKISQATFKDGKPIILLPFYAIPQWP